MINLETEKMEALEHGQCPACGGRGFVMGPQGGMAVNIECANVHCRERYNVSFYGGQVVFAQHIGNGREGPPWPSEPRQ